MQAIETKYLEPTNTRGARVKAWSEAFPRGVTVPWDHALSIEENHAEALRAFIRAREWYGSWVMGGAPGGRGVVAVCLSRFDEASPHRFQRPAPGVVGDPGSLLTVLPESPRTLDA